MATKNEVEQAILDARLDLLQGIIKANTATTKRDLAEAYARVTVPSGRPVQQQVLRG